MTEMTAAPASAAVRERASSLANEAMLTIALQVRRLGSKEPEDGTFIFRWWADLQFLIVSLRRLRRIAELASKVDDSSQSIKAAIETFDRALPYLAVMRNVGEHIDSYAIDHPKRHHTEVDRRYLQVGTWDGEVFTWLADKNELPLQLNVNDAKAAAVRLYSTVRELARPAPATVSR
jgi:hypothetical protein